MHPERVARVLEAAVREGLLGEEAPAALFYDLDEFRSRLAGIREAFPADTLHTIAIKANPLSAMLREASAAGWGAECASLPELEHALRLGFPADRLVFDSPAKTMRELRFALERGVSLNVDNFQELERIAALRASGAPEVRVGLRVNPQTGAGAYEGTSTATATSKFGIPLQEERARILEAFERLPWLSGLHVHTGSQHCGLELVVRGVTEIVDLAREIERGRGRRVEFIDIGGGLPVDYETDAPDPLLPEYVALLRERAPGLFEHRLVTEFGRAVSARAGWAASRVEYTKSSGGRRIAVIHLGADLLVRTAYVPERWPHRLSVHTREGLPKAGPRVAQDVAGPLCFSFDLVARQRVLPEAEPGELVVIHDVGAYTLSMWSRYNSRQVPPVIGYELGAAGVRLRVLKPGETVDETLAFWGP